MTDIEISQSAAGMIETYGSGAAMAAAMQADKLKLRKNAIGCDVWQQIALAIRALENEGRAGGGGHRHAG